jgi:hypothetical protein
LHAATDTCATLCAERSEAFVAEHAATIDAIAAREAHAPRERRFAENMLPPWQWCGWMRSNVARFPGERR